MAIIGEIRTFGTDDQKFLDQLIRAGWLPCDGRSLRTNDYQKLYAAIGPRWGSKDPNLTFLVPDLRGRFVRGRSLGNEPGDDPRDPDGADRWSPVPELPGVIPPVEPWKKNPRAVGSLQRDGLRFHEHGLGVQRFGAEIKADEHKQTYMGIGRPEPASETTIGGGPFNRDTRPKNVYVEFWIFAGLPKYQVPDGRFFYPDDRLATEEEYQQILAAQLH